MHISLPPDLEQLIQTKVQSGRYFSVGEVIREGLRLLEERDQLQSMRLAELQQKISAGMAQADRGELFDEDEVFAELEADIQKIEASRG